MTDDTVLLKTNAQKILDERTDTGNDPGISDLPGTLGSRLLDHAAEGHADLRTDRWVRGFAFITLKTITQKPWEKESEIYEKLPPYGFRRPEETAMWAQWFSSNTRRTLLVNRFLLTVKGTDMQTSVYDMMYETFRYEQMMVASRVIDFLRQDLRRE